MGALLQLSQIDEARDYFICGELTGTSSCVIGKFEGDFAQLELVLAVFTAAQ